MSAPPLQMGAYHTIDLEMNRKFTLQKPEWDAIALERIEMATNPARTADIAAVVMAEGLAQVCLITSSMTIVRQRIESTIPRKRKGSASLHEKVLSPLLCPPPSPLVAHAQNGKLG